MYYVYIIEGLGASTHFYVGSTQDIAARLTDHNAERSTHTAKYHPWKLVWYCAFPKRVQAEAFETYLKSASGRAFQRKHLAPSPRPPYDLNPVHGI